MSESLKKECILTNSLSENGQINAGPHSNMKCSKLMSDSLGTMIEREAGASEDECRDTLATNFQHSRFF